jgi:hypothetical protein
LKTREPEAIRFEIEDAMRRRDWRKIEEIANADLRHKTGSQPIDYLMHWCNVARIFAYATKDYTWGEFEKEFAILIKQVCKYRVLSELLLEYRDLDPDPSKSVGRWNEIWREFASICDWDVVDKAIGATGNHPEGQIDPGDEGELAFKVAADPVNHKVLLHFGKPVAWIGMNPDDARQLGLMLIQKGESAK